MTIARFESLIFSMSEEELPPGISLLPLAIDVAKRCKLDQSPVTNIIG